MYVYLTPTTPSHLFTKPPPPPPTKKKFCCQIRILCQIMEKYLPLKKMDSLSNKFTSPPHSPRTHTPPPTPAHFFFLIWIICQLDSVLVNFFYKLTKNPNIKKNLNFRARGAGGRAGVNIMYKCLKWHFYSSRTTNVPNYSEIHDQIQKKWSRQAQFMTILSFDLQVWPSP